MNIEELYDFCLKLKGTKEDFPFDKDILVFKVGDKIFCLTSLQKWETGEPFINLKCNPGKAIELRIQHHGITPAYHMNKKHWNSVLVNNGISDEYLMELVQDSYQLVFDSLGKKMQENIG